MTLLAGSTVRADGGDGAVARQLLRGSGGGSGGGILIHGDTIQASGSISARGGQGGRGGSGGNGGGGGGGRIAFQFRTPGASGSTNVTGGASGARSTDGCCPGGGAGPDATGAPGLVTLAQAASSATGPATSVSSTGATLNGSINPHGSATKFHFDFGTTTGYGSRVPSSDASIGSDNADHGVSQAVGGLAPSTTYHYRLVAIDALGFTTRGADATFTTPPCPVPAAEVPPVAHTPVPRPAVDGELQLARVHEVHEAS